jgi:heat shock protein HslJ
MTEHRGIFHLAAAVSLVALLGCVAQPLATGQTAGAGQTAGKGTTSMDALQGKTWVLTQFDDGSPAPAEPAITAELKDGKISGSGGCNRYFASVTSPSPGVLHVGPISATKMACLGPVGENEQRYFAALTKVNRYSLEDGRLVLLWEREGQAAGKMVFKTGSP